MDLLFKIKYLKFKLGPFEFIEASDRTIVQQKGILGLAYLFIFKYSMRNNNTYTIIKCFVKPFF